MKRIFLNAYDKINLGDDLFIRFIAHRYPKVKFFIWTDKINKKTFKDVGNIIIIDKESNFVKTLGVLRCSFVSRYKKYLEDRCNAVVYIGGSIFIEYDNWINQINWFNYQIRNKFFVLGANFGPYKSPEYKKELNYVFKKMEDVCFRDKYSYLNFSQNEIVRYAPDILFGQYMPKTKIIRNQIFVSVINCVGRNGIGGIEHYHQNYMDNLLLLLKKYVTNGFTLVISSFCEEERDVYTVNEIFEQLEEYRSSIKICNYNGINSSKLLEEISMSEYVIATRFHAMILGLAENKPVLPIIYSDKTINVLNDLNFEGEIIDLRKDKDWSLISEPHKWGSLSIDMTNRLKVDSQLHFSKLDEFLR